MDYKVLYDISQEGHQSWNTLVFGMLFCATPALAIWYQRRAKWRFPVFIKLILGGMIFAGGFSFVSFAIGYWYYLDVQAAVRQSKYQVVEGVVTNLHQPKRFSTGIHGTRWEPAVFSVGNIPFRCWDKANQRGHDFFQRSDLLRDGLPVRICYVNLNGQENVITRLESDE